MGRKRCSESRSQSTRGGFGLVVTAVMGKGGGEGTWLDGRGCFLLTEAVKEGQDAGPVTQYGLTAAHQLGVNAGQL